MVICIFICVDSQTDCEFETETLCINKINLPGFGQVSNRYAFAMEEFKGYVYVSTLNAVNVPEGIAAFFNGLEFETYGTQIWRATLDNKENINATALWDWQRVVTNGTVVGNGPIETAVWNYGVRKFAVVDEFLYTTTGNHRNGFEVWKSFDGYNWEAVLVLGQGDDENTSGRGLGSHSGYLYVGAENRETGAKMFRRKVETNGDLDPASFWEAVITDGLGDANNYWFSDFMEYNGYLYTGTLNAVDGMQLWRTLDGGSVAQYQMVFASEQVNQAAMKLFVYGDKLYIGTMNLAVIWYPELCDFGMCGASVFVNNDAEGLSFAPVFTGGGPNVYKNPLNAYMWYIQDFQNRLYVGTFDMNGLTGEDLAVGFDLFSSDQPFPVNEQNWIRETNDAFGNPGNYGLRSMTVIGDKLIIGTATANDETGGCTVFKATLRIANNKGNAYGEKRETIKNEGYRV